MPPSIDDATARQPLDTNPGMKTTLSMIYHVFLPPKLPQKDDYTPLRDSALTDMILYSLQKFNNVLCQNDNLDHVISMVENFRAVHDQYGHVTQTRLEDTLAALSDNELEVTVLHVREQNAGIILRRDPDGVVIEVFELTPANKSVVSTRGRLQRSFPAFAVSIPLTVFSDYGFRVTLSQTVSKMSAEYIDEMQPKVKKAGEKQSEIRDTAIPHLVTEHLLTFSRPSADPSNSQYKQFMVFFMARILSLALDLYGIESDIIYAMNAKLSRRLIKVENYEAALWFGRVRDTMIRAQSCIDNSWKSVMADLCPPMDLSALREINPTENVIHDLPDLDFFLHQVQSLSKTRDREGFSARGSFPGFDPGRLPDFANFDLDSLHISFGLAALETWVELHLKTWLDRHINVTNTCVALKALIMKYHCKAQDAYRGNPESVSVMVLTVIDLWIACDKIACRLYPLLIQYDHEMDSRFFWSLLLSLKSHLSRISNAESYLQSRISQANKTLDRAAQQVASKLQELAEINRLHRELMDQYEGCSCEHLQVTRYDINGSPHQETQHSSHCRKCAYLRKANSMVISVHEWPISKNPNTAKATIFELTVPPDFGAWRDITMYTLQAVLGYRYDTERSMGSDYTLPRDPSIRFFYRSNNERVGIRSHTKPNRLTHRKRVSIPAPPASVCLNNGLSYQYFDFKTGSLICTFATTDELHDQCTFVLPARSRPLQRFLQRTPAQPNGPEPNEVIARLCECPEGMSMDEFKAFALLPLGYEIQWHNILSQLAIPSLDFTKVDTTLLLLQTSQQIGPSSNSLSRTSHEVLCHETFAASLLGQLHKAKRRVGENWESFEAVAAFICLAARLLASTPFIETQEECLEYLASCRSLLFGWVTKLRGKVQNCTDDAQRTEFAARAVEVALICMSSFGIDSQHLKSVLVLTADASVFLQCSITIQEHLSSIDLSSSSSASIFLARWRRLMYKTYPELVRIIIVLGSSCLNDAIRKVWAGYVPGAAWHYIPAPHQQWLQSSSSSDGYSESFAVQFNLLTAELLVNGAPLAKLPAEYENHAMYSTLFGRSHTEVMPSSRPGFQFSSMCEYAGHLIHFGFFGEDMLLHAVSDERSYSLVPLRVLLGHFPQAFVHDYVHWFDHQLRAVIFVPIKIPWSQSPYSWRLSRSGGDGWELAKGDEILVSIQSRAAKVIANILSPLEDNLFLHITFHAGSIKVDIELPRLRLGFFFNTGSDTIWSRQFQDVTIDHNQNFGTLFGLTSKLVLTSHDGDRQVLIPEGSVLYQRQSGHVSVSIARGVSRVHSYCVDGQMCRLVGSGSMQAMLLLC
ncbi:uncharacterized protein RAG0_03169 [Rhynchosporium agropyri]|uniref:ubiquitinyl hydrolase 1 n=1 Tax=Rhynchosporium agropyri TaxID=914238 RepID=A0A1E1K364_9HELO|nr:uncharacterized protein RAG0_03169 [Rhynchosporium agropyri]